MKWFAVDCIQDKARIVDLDRFYIIHEYHNSCNICHNSRMNPLSALADIEDNFGGKQGRSSQDSVVDHRRIR